MRCEVVAVGTELLLGQVVDTNSSWIGEQLALIGVDSHYQTKVGDNFDRMVEVLETALARSDAVIVCGGLGPTQDDITRDVIAAVLGVELVRDDELVEKIRAMFDTRGRVMPENNMRQAEIPVGATANPVQPGTAPGLICPVGDTGKVIYAVPGVPWEMKEMLDGGVLPDLRERAGSTSVIRSRVLRTWGQSESGLAEQLDDEIRRLDEAGTATIAFLASGWEGMKVRITAKAASADEADAVLADEELRVRKIIGDIVFAVDDDTMESVVLAILTEQHLTLGLSESLTGGLIGARLTGVPGASSAFRGAIVPYDRRLKIDLLGAPDVPAVSKEMALAMAEGACRVLGTDVGLAVTGVAGPAPLEGVEPGTVWIGLWLDRKGEAVELTLPFDRDRIRQFTTITSLNLLRTRLLMRAG